MPGTWTSIANFPNFSVSMALLLTDGNVLCQEWNTGNWRRLVPDAAGRYASGNWETRAYGPHGPLYYASAVLADGRVFLAGGEYDFGRELDLLAAAIYDPQQDAWTPIGTPWYWTKIGDAPCCVLPDRRVLLGAIESSACAIFDPKTGFWDGNTSYSKLNLNSNEETWVLLRDGSVLSIDCNGHPATERFIDGAWRWEPNTPVDLVEDSSKEVGPAVLLPDGDVFAIGATGYTALYSAGDDTTKRGKWRAGPMFGKDTNGFQLGAKDAPACLLPNGRVLCAVGPLDGVAGNYLGPTSFFEYDPDASTLNPIPSPGNSARTPSSGILLLLPSGEVMFINGTADVWFYLPNGEAKPVWCPTITNVPDTLARGQQYQLEGTQLNGLSQACSYGDDAAMATNYPLVRLRSLASGAVRYCRTFNHSTMGVTAGAPGSTSFEVPTDGLVAGQYVLSVVANAIASAERAVTVTDPAVG